MFYNILDQKRIDILPFFESFKNNFYLAGGTALALQLGHRDSVDFDFFTEEDINTKILFDKIKEVFKGRNVKKVQEEKNTLTVVVDNNVKISFFTYKYPLLDKLIIEDNFRLASVRDIACMKLSAIVSRSTMKDYVDLYFILQTMTLANLLKGITKKFPELDINLVLKSLVYFDDIITEEIVFKNNQIVTMEELKRFFTELVKKYNEQ